LRERIAEGITQQHAENEIKKVKS